MARDAAPRPPFRLGDRVLVRFGAGKLPAMVIEDRGPLGVEGRRIYRVRVILEEPYDFEAPAEDIEPEPRRRSSPAVA